LQKRALAGTTSPALLQGAGSFSYPEKSALLLRKADADAQTSRQVARFATQPGNMLASFGLPRGKSTGMLTHCLQRMLSASITIFEVRAALIWACIFLILLSVERTCVNLSVQSEI
jgi:hypothetical protein